MKGKESENRISVFYSPSLFSIRGTLPFHRLCLRLLTIHRGSSFHFDGPGTIRACYVTVLLRRVRLRVCVGVGTGGVFNRYQSLIRVGEKW